jgi:hypothetical protein
MRFTASRHGRFGSLTILTALLVMAPVASARAAHTPTQGGVRIAPAAIRLELTKSQNQTSTSFSLTNTYSTPVTLQLAIQHSAQNAHGNVDPTTLVSLDSPILTIPAGATSSETVTLRDSKNLSPGSQIVDLVVVQHSAGNGSAGVGVQPAVRLPVTIIKDDGAVMSLGLTNIASPGFTMQSPRAITVTIKNTGNLVAIPRGIVTIRDPRGVVIGQGVINTASAAIVPGSELKTAVAITAITQATAPGAYHLTATYGLGGDSGDKTVSVSYVFVAWWHIATIIAGVLAAILIITNFRHIRHYIAAHRKKPDRIKGPPAKRRILIGRNA